MNNIARWLLGDREESMLKHHAVLYSRLVACVVQCADENIYCLLTFSSTSLKNIYASYKFFMVLLKINIKFICLFDHDVASAA